MFRLTHPPIRALGFAFVLLLSSAPAAAGTLTIPNTFAANTKAVAVAPQYPTVEPQPTSNTDDDVWQAFFFASESTSPTAAGNRDDWKTEELMSEIVRRTHGDVPALRALQADVLQALLNAIDHQRAETGRRLTTTSRT